MPKSTRYLSFERLEQYDGLMKNWVLKKIVEAGGMTEEQVRAIFTEMFNAARKSGVANDIRTFDSITNFPLVTKVTVEGVDHYYTTKWTNDYTDTKPTADVEYVNKETQTEYIWKEFKSTDPEYVNYSGEYVMVNQTANKGDIEDIFD